jgi:hypothetical protein
MGNTGMYVALYAYVPALVADRIPLRMQLNLGPGVAATAENITPMLANIPVRIILVQLLGFQPSLTVWATDGPRLRALRRGCYSSLPSE